MKRSEMIKLMESLLTKMEEEKVNICQCYICKGNYREEDIDFFESRRLSKDICVRCVEYIKENVTNKKQNININFHELLLISSKRMESIYQDNLFKPSFNLTELVSPIKFDFSKEYNGIFELLKEFILPWKLMTKEDKNIFCEFVVGKRLSDDLWCFMNILSERKSVSISFE